MEFIISLIGVGVVLMLGISLFFMIMTPPRYSPVDPHWVDVSCPPEGAALSPQARLHTAVTLLDGMVKTGRAPSGFRMTMEQVRGAADVFAQQYTSPDATLVQLSQYSEWSIGAYAHGYWTMSSALTRESLRRHASGVRHDI